ncbi:hypothetical protein CR513_33167, partial [Mucuna pruriens]
MSGVWRSKQLYSLTFLCSKLLYHKFSLLYSTLPQILLVLPLWFWDVSSLLPRLCLYLNCTSLLVLNTFLLVYLHRMCGLSKFLLLLQHVLRIL